MLSNSLWWATSVAFTCRARQILVDYNNKPFHGITRCQRDGTWSRQWPMCKGNVYQYCRDNLINYNPFLKHFKLDNNNNDFIRIDY